MGILRVGRAETRARIVRLAEPRAFDSYLRHGRIPEADSLLAAADHLAAGHATTHYTWRTAQDERVHSGHAANAGRVFSWTDPPSTGHPGAAHNCRCWPEPYYGAPGVPSVPLRHERRVDNSGKAPWTSIDTVKRPDGSLAQSHVSLRNGARIVSTFAGSQVTHAIMARGGKTVRMERRNGITALYVGDGKEPVGTSEWMPDGPHMPPPTPGHRFDDIEIREPFKIVGPARDDVLGSVPFWLLWLYNMLVAEPESLGAGSSDVPAVTLKVWQQPKGKSELSLSLQVLSAEQIEKSCKRMLDVQSWTNEAATLLMPRRAAERMSPQQWGTAVHKAVEDEIKRLKEAFPGLYKDIDAELSISRDEGLTWTRVRNIAERVFLTTAPYRS